MQRLVCLSVCKLRAHNLQHHGDFARCLIWLAKNTMIERDIDITCIARRLASPPKLDTLWWWQWDDTWNLMIGDVGGSPVSVDTSLYKLRCGCGLR